MFLLKAYIASLTSILVSRDLRLAVSGWQELSARGLPWGLVAQSPTQTYLASSSDPKLQQLLNKAVVFDTFDEAVTALRQGKIPALISECVARVSAGCVALPLQQATWLLRYAQLWLPRAAFEGLRVGFWTHRHRSLLSIVVSTVAITVAIAIAAGPSSSSTHACSHRAS